MKKIISKQNETIKRIKSLEKKKYREKYSEILLEGYRLIEDAADSVLIIKTVLYVESVDKKKAILVERLSESGTEAIEADEEVFEYISDTVNSQGILAIAKMPSNEFEDIPQKPQGFMIYLDCMQDPGNLGTVIRTADAAGAECVAISSGSVDAYNAKVLRSAMGSVFHLPVIQKVPGKQFIEDLKRGGYRIIAADLKGAREYREMDYGEKVCLVIGNEGSGIRDEILDICDESVKIPIIGRAESLNASVAAGILLYDIAMKRNC
ncbi:MAG: RNA methyltransferase [Peptostreptococcaceae bacterium]|nr:RNA methyltransferase [Peptostreptococcaceae bacterium]